jgi:hypothetical protein
LRVLQDVPIIIGGCGRSGTTLILAILGSHPRIFAIPEETRIFCPTAYERVPNLCSPINLEAIQAFLDKQAVPESCTRWCEKTPKNVLFFERILGAFQDRVRLIHVVRDGRDVITSLHPNNPHRFHVSQARWVAEVTYGLRFQHDPRVLTVRYEDIVLDFEPTIRRVCDFLGEEFLPELLDWSSKTNIRWQKSWHQGSVRPLYKTAIGRWRSAGYNKIIDQFLSNIQSRECLQRLGYPI